MDGTGQLHDCSSSPACRYWKGQQKTGLGKRVFGDKWWFILSHLAPISRVRKLPLLHFNQQRSDWPKPLRELNMSLCSQWRLGAARKSKRLARKSKRLALALSQPSIPALPESSSWWVSEEGREEEKRFYFCLLFQATDFVPETDPD